MVLHFFKDGGLFFTIPIFALLILILVLLVKAFKNIDNNDKTISLISSIAWFSIAWGYLGRTIGLIQSFDDIAAAGEIALNIFAPGIKVALINPLFGLITFIIARLGIIILLWIKKKQTTKVF